MSPAETELVLAISERAGIALVDTLGHPGPTHRAGRPIENHLGTLGLYGFNQRSYAFLHEPGGRLRPRAEQCVFFLKSRVGERATSFTPARREALRMVQITDRREHVAPDVELSVVMRAEPFLRRVLAGLDVAPALLAARRAAIATATVVGDDPGNRIPSVPMSSNYFFAQLGGLVGEMVRDGYGYTGVYDVGRSSVSAARAIPRTAYGYAGWYGRALMGDAPASLPILAVTEPGDVVAFVGDGGRSIVADPIPALIDNALAYPERFADKSVTIFYFSNGTYSGIRSYRERLSSRWGGRQMRTIDLLDAETEQSFGPLRLVRRRIVAFDGPALRQDLLARGRLNVVTVVLAHNNDDDGFSFVTSGWRRDLPERV
jgi:thiamine pyrophosphate-dependent acetolactate synthase large subunit-like protein